MGDEAALVGPDAPARHPNQLAQRSGRSVYNMSIHLSPTLARRVVG